MGNVISMQEGSVIINAQKITSIIKNFPDCDICIESDDRNMVRITGGMSDFTIHGVTAEAFPNLSSKWFGYVLKGTKPPVENGKVTYYKLFDNCWYTDDFKTPEKSITFTIGEGEKTYTYNPFAPATFKGGLTSSLDGTAWQDEPNSRYDILSFYTPEFTEDTCIKGKMKARLRVKSDCEDTCFYMRISIKTDEGDLGLRDDINKISNFNPDYKIGDALDMDFTFDEHSFLVKKGQALRIDISSSCHPYFVRHTNQKGPFALQTTAKVAHNTVILDESTLTVFC
jgi:ribosomal protein L31